MKPTSGLSNSQAELAHKAGAAWERHRRADREAIAAYIETGELLREAKAGCKHGEFGAVLERAGIPRRTAARAMKLAEYGVKLVTVTHLGIRRTLEAITASGIDPNHPVPEMVDVVLRGRALHADIKAEINAERERLDKLKRAADDAATEETLRRIKRHAGLAADCGDEAEVRRYLEEAQSIVRTLEEAQAGIPAEADEMARLRAEIERLEEKVAMLSADNPAKFVEERKQRDRDDMRRMKTECAAKDRTIFGLRKAIRDCKARSGVL